MFVSCSASAFFIYRASTAQAFTKEARSQWEKTVQTSVLDPIERDLAAQLQAYHQYMQGGEGAQAGFFMEVVHFSCVCVCVCLNFRLCLSGHGEQSSAARVSR